MASYIPEKVPSELSVPQMQNYASAENLFKELLTFVLAETAVVPLPANSLEAQQVLLDICVDNARYLLVRFPIPLQNNSLSPREQEIARLVAKGLPNKAIASVLDISSWTVASHLRRIFAKMGVSTRAEMVAEMMRGKLHPQG